MNSTLLHCLFEFRLKERIAVTLMNGIRERVDYMIKLTLNLTKIKANKKSAT